MTETAAKPSIISASRRTDIPAFYMAWMMNRLREGTVRYPNPWTGQPHEVSLRPDDVHSIVFWSKDYAPFLEQADELDALGYLYGCHYTITGIPRELEPSVPPWQAAAHTLRRLAARIGPGRVWWRFDPILLTQELGARYYLQLFAEMAQALEGQTERCYFSFADFYGKVQRRLAVEGIPAIDPELSGKQAMVQEMAAIAGERGMSLHACCEDDVVSGVVQKAHCIDADLLSELFPGRRLAAAARPTRESCGCAASRDIGMYDSCPHRCLYCYANQGNERVEARWRRHDPEGEMLVPEGR